MRPVFAILGALLFLCSCSSREIEQFIDDPSTAWKGVSQSWDDEQWMISNTPRLRNVKIPKWMQPTIKIIDYDLHGSIHFSSRTAGQDRLPQKNGYEYQIITASESGQVDSGASGHGTKDSRWNKYWGDRTVAFMVVLVKSGRSELVEFSRLQKARRK